MDLIATTGLNRTFFLDTDNNFMLDSKSDSDSVSVSIYGGSKFIFFNIFCFFIIRFIHRAISDAKHNINLSEDTPNELALIFRYSNSFFRAYGDNLFNNV